MIYQPIDFTYKPIIKGRGFCPNPIAKFGGIPAFADSLSYPKVIGTTAHADWWNEQIHYIINGYETGGIFIPGRYYYYLNFPKITTVKRGNHFPDFVDIDLEFFRLVEYVKEKKRGIISLKGRRRGLSEKAAKGIIDYGYRFKPENYRAGIVAGLQVYSDGFFNKQTMINPTLPPELQLHQLSTDQYEYISGYKVNTGVGEEKLGSLNRVLSRTMHTNPNVFKGEFLDDCIFEESGEFKILLRGYSATKACFQVGTKMVGTPYVYGTGGKITSSSEAFKEMYYDAESYHLEKLPVMGQRLLVGYFVGSTNEDGKPEYDTPNIDKMKIEQGLSDEQVLGCEDVKRADEVILENRALLSKAKNFELYFEYFLDNPREEKDCFLNFSGNNFDTESLATRALKIAETPQQLLYNYYRLEFKKNKEGQLLKPLQVEAIPATPEQIIDNQDIIMIRPDGFPLKGSKDLVCAGVDSYDQDRARTSKSLGAAVFLARKGNTCKSIDGQSVSHKRVPIALIRCRPKRKELFYLNVLKGAIFWNLKYSTLIDAGKPMIIKTFEDYGEEHRLAFRPKSFESANSEQTHLYGIAFTGSPKSKQQCISLFQSYILDEIDECNFPDIIEGAQAYDVEQKDSDWDDVDAMMIALAQDTEMRMGKIEMEDETEDPYAFPDWRDDGNGNYIDMSAVKKKSGETESSDDIFLNLIQNNNYDDF